MKEDILMSEKLINILGFIIVGLLVVGGKHIDLSLLERIIALILFDGLLEIIYRKTKKENK